jgi:transposase-like protein
MVIGCEHNDLRRYGGSHWQYFCKDCKKAFAVTFSDPNTKLDPELMSKNGKLEPRITTELKAE